MIPSERISKPYNSTGCSFLSPLNDYDFSVLYFLEAQSFPYENTPNLRLELSCLGMA